MYQAKVDDFENSHYGFYCEKKEPALFTQRPWFESLCIYACVMKFFCPVVMANVINACKRWWLGDLTLSQKVWMLLVFFKTYHSLLPLCVMALGINARWRGDWIYLLLFSLFKCVVPLCQGCSYHNEPPPVRLKYTHTHTHTHTHKAKRVFQALFLILELCTRVGTTEVLNSSDQPPNKRLSYINIF